MDYLLRSNNWPSGQIRMTDSPMFIGPTQTQKIWGSRHHALTPKLIENVMLASWC